MSNLSNFGAYLVFYSALHSLLASQRVKDRTFTILPWIERPYRFLYSLISVILLIPVISALSGSPLLYEIPDPYATAALCGQVLFGSGFWWSVRSFNVGHFLGYRVPDPEAPSTFSDSAAYGWCRHPLYFFASGFLVLKPSVSEAYALFVVWTVGYFWLGSWIEEARMLRAFGDA